MANDPTIPGMGDPGSVPRRGVIVKLLVLPFDGRHPGFRAHCRDISHRGLFIPTTRTVAVDSLLVLKLLIGKRQILEATAQVIHSVPGHGFGCRFLDLDHENQRMLSLLVAACNAAPREARTLGPPSRRRIASHSITWPHR